jgi:radical SAM superfamily enzyme YgiQ (UPF0313 family)
MDFRQKEILIVYPFTPDSFWGCRYSNGAMGARANLAPLAPITVAAMLPKEWIVRFVDMNVRELLPADIDRADFILVTGMVAQKRSIAEVICQAHARTVRKPVVVGGPFASATPNAPELRGADAIFIGEAEDKRTFGELLEDMEKGTLKRAYHAKRFPDLADSPTPRYDLLERGAYVGYLLQSSRGCPFACDYCDVVQLYGKSRYKTPAQIVRELQAIFDTGFRGHVFLADDNLIGNQRMARQLLAEIGAWQKAHDHPFQLYTQVVIGLADDDETMDLMVKAGFYAVFIGLETPSAAALRSARKKQNLAKDIVAACKKIRKRLLILGGFMLGFDTDGPGCFGDMIDFVGATGIAHALVGMVMAPVDTPLWKRLLGEGRIRSEAPGDACLGTNIVPKLMTYAELLRGYRRVVKKLYSPRNFFRRARRGLSEWQPYVRHKVTRREVRAFAWSVLRQGVFSTYAPLYWLFILRFAGTGKFGKAVAAAVLYRHFRLFIHRTVLPGLDTEIAILGRNGA